MTAPPPPLTDEQFNFRDGQIQAALVSGARHHWLLIAEQLRDDARWHRAENAKLREALLAIQQRANEFGPGELSLLDAVHAMHGLAHAALAPEGKEER